MSIQTQLPLLKCRRTKLVATLGPAIANPDKLAALFVAGVDVVRLNMSHGSQQEHRAACDLVRRTAADADRTVAILADLGGPKIRIGSLRGGSLELGEGERVTVTVRDVEGGPGLIPSRYRALARDVAPNDRLLLDDGQLELRAEKISGTEISCRVVQGGILRDNKGMNLPGVRVSAPSLTAKDRSDVAFALDQGIDFLALSFVRSAADVLELRDLIHTAGGQAMIISKIEKPEALEDIDAILAASDAIMIARGDLGVELPPEKVPVAQAQLIDLAHTHRKPVIVATQMLESMVTNPQPTRAEASDVANAVLSGADAVMLSEESAIGRYPLQAIEMMNRIARQTERYLWELGAFGALADSEHLVPPIPEADAIAGMTARLSRALLVRAIVVVSTGDRSAAVMSSSHPAAPIIALTRDSRETRVANLLWGVTPVLGGPADLEQPEVAGRRILRELGLAESGQKFLIVYHLDDQQSETSPTISVVTV